MFFYQHKGGFIMVSQSFVVFDVSRNLPLAPHAGLGWTAEGVSRCVRWGVCGRRSGEYHGQNKNATNERGATSNYPKEDNQVQNNFSINQNLKSTINKSNPKYSHLSEDAQKFLEHCDKHNVPSIIKHTGRDAEFKTRPFHSNGNGDMPDYYCVRFLASISYREILTAWNLYEIKDGGFLLTNNDWNKPGFSHFHLHFDKLEEIRQHSMAPVELVLNARKALCKFRKAVDEQQNEPERQPLIGIPTQEDEPAVAIKPKREKAKLKTEAELKKLSDALLNADIHVPTTEDNYWLRGRGEF